MRSIFPLFFISVLFASCHQHVPLRLSRFDSIAPIDTTCKHEVNSANADILKGKLTYCHFIGMVSSGFRSENEFMTALRIYNITYRTQAISDVITDQTQGCYCDFMSDKISERYGIKFIDSLLNIADSIYLANNINDTIRYTDCDAWPRYAGDPDTSNSEQSAIFQEQCDVKIKYPVGYRKKTDLNNAAFVNVYFIVSKTGEAKIVGYHFLFDKESNDIYEPYFRRQIEKIANKQGWTPAQIRKQNVTSEFTLRVYFE
jgi:hypothetical protein